jgi:hypothetical protein
MTRMVAARGCPILKAGGFYALQIFFEPFQRSYFSFLGFGPRVSPQ